MASSLDVLINQALGFYQSAIAPSTRASYMVGWRSYEKFCGSLGVSVVPPDFTVLWLWLGELASMLKAATAVKYFRGVCSLLVEMGFPHPITTWPPLRRMITGVFKSSTIREVVKPKLVLDPSLVSVLISYLDLNDFFHLSFACAMLVGVCGLLRNGELAAPEVEDILRVDHLSAAPGGNGYLLYFRRTKTMRVGEGVHVLIAHPYVTRLLSKYLRIRIKLIAKLKETPTGFPFLVSSAVASPYLFYTLDGRPLMRHLLRRDLVQLLTLAGRDVATYRSFSFRAGGASSLQQDGVSVDLIKYLGRWRSDAYEVYTSPTLTSLAAVQSRMKF